MRTADEILDSLLPKNIGVRECVIEAINEARREAIQRCAQKLVEPVYDFNGKRYNDQLQKMILDIRKELK